MIGFVTILLNFYVFVLRLAFSFAAVGARDSQHTWGGNETDIVRRCRRNNGHDLSFPNRRAVGFVLGGVLGGAICASSSADAERFGIMSLPQINKGCPQSRYPAQNMLWSDNLKAAGGAVAPRDRARAFLHLHLHLHLHGTRRRFTQSGRGRHRDFGVHPRPFRSDPACAARLFLP